MCCYDDNCPASGLPEVLAKAGIKISLEGSSVVKNPPANAGDTRDADLIPGSGRSTGVGNGNPLQYSCLENPMDRGALWATVHGVAKSRTCLSYQACTSYRISNVSLVGNLISSGISMY